MNTKGIKFLAVLAVLAMAFAAFAAITYTDGDDAAPGDLTISNGEAVVVGDFAGTDQSALNTMTNAAQGNDIAVTSTTVDHITTYKVAGVLSYKVFEAGTTAQKLGMPNGEVLYFNQTLAAESDKVFISTDGTTWTEKTKIGTGTTEPWAIGCSYDKYYIASGASTSDLKVAIIDLSEVYRSVQLADGIVDWNTPAQWTYTAAANNTNDITTGILAFNGINERVNFKAEPGLNLLITVNGVSNAIHGYGEIVVSATSEYDKNGNWDGWGLGNTGKITIKSSSSSKAALTVVQDYSPTEVGTASYVMMSGSYGDIVIGDSGASSKNLELTVSGGNRGIYAYANLFVYNAKIDATSSGFAIRTPDHAGIPEIYAGMKLVKSDVTLGISTDSKLEYGAARIFGFEGDAISIDADSKLITSGLKINGTATANYYGSASAISNFINNGIILVKGDYAQNSGASTVAGFVLANGTVTAKRADTIGITLGTFLSSDAGYAGAGTITVTNAANHTEKVTDDTDQLKTDLSTANVDRVNFNITGALDKTIAADTVVKDNQQLHVAATSTGTLNGDLTVGSAGSDPINVSFSGVLGEFTVSKGSVKIDGTIKAGTITIPGDADVTNLIVAGDANIVVSGDSSKIKLDGLTVESGTLTITGADIEANSSVKIKAGAALIIGTGSTKVNASELKVSGAGSVATIIYGDASSSYSFAEDEIITGTFYIGTAKYDLAAAVAGTGGLSISSSGLSGTIAGGKVTMSTGKVSGLTVSADSDLAGTYTVSGRITVATGVTLDLADGAKATITIGSAGIITVNGILEVSNALPKTDIENNGTIVVNGALDVNFNDRTVITGEGTIEYGTSENVNISGVVSADATYVEKQIVTFNGDTKIKSGADLTINGQVIVNGDVTLTIEQNASITVTGSAARFTNDGKIVLEAYSDTVGGSALTIAGNAVAINNGEITVFGEETKTSTLTTGGKLTNNGIITINADATLSGAITNSKDATLTLKGIYDGAAVKNYGAIIIDGKVSGNIDVYDKDAAVGLLKKIGTADGDADKLTITAKADIAGTTNKSKVGAREAQISIDPKSGYVVAGLGVLFGSEASNAAKTEYRTLITLTGSVTVSKADGESMPETIAVYNVLGIAKEKVIVSDLLTVDSYTNINLAAGTKLVVSGALISKLASSNAEVKSIDGTGTLSVTGLVTLAKDVDAAVAKEGAFFSVKDEETSKYTYYYTTLAAAIESEAKTIAVFGEQTISEDITIPAEVTVTTNNAVTIKSGATVTVTNGAKLNKGADVTVNGKLIVENKKNLAGVGIVKSAVKTTLGDAEIYSGLAAALSEAEIGSVVVLLDDVEVTEDLTIPDDKALDVGDATLSVKGATLTVDGMLYLRNTNLSVTDKDADNKGALKVTGIMVSDKAFTEKGTAKNAPAGAYYQVVYESAPYYCMSTLDVAMAISMIDIIEGNVELYGENMLGNVAVLKSIDVYSTKFVAGTVTIADKTAVTFKNAVNDVTAVFVNSTGSVVLKDADVKANTVFKSSDKSVFTVAGEIATGDVDSPVLFIGSSNLEAKIDFAMVTGDVTVSASKEVANLYVTGTVTVNNAKTLTVTTLTLLGSMVAKEKSDTDGAAGKIVIKDDSFIGADAEDVLGAGAVLAGKVELEGVDIILYVMAGSTVPEELFDKTTGLKYTTIAVDGKEYITLMTNGANVHVPADLIIPVTDGKMDAINPWIVDGEEDDDFIIGETAAVAVNADFNIYRVTVTADEGIASVYIDDILMINEAGNVFQMNDLKAGTHTIKYLIKSGYEGTPVLKFVTGKDGSVMGMNVTLKGTEGLDGGVSTVNLQLSGTSPAVTPTPEPTPTPEEKSEWTITTILLVILVILIAILVVVLILRLNRS